MFTVIIVPIVYTFLNEVLNEVYASGKDTQGGGDGAGD